MSASTRIWDHSFACAIHDGAPCTCKEDTEVEELVNGSSATGYQIRDTGTGWILCLASTGEVLDSRERGLSEIVATVNRYDRMNRSLS